MNFWYHAYGATIGSLNVYTRIRNELSVSPIWKIEKNQGNQWRAAAVTIIPDEDFQVNILEELSEPLSSLKL